MKRKESPKPQEPERTNDYRTMLEKVQSDTIETLKSLLEMAKEREQRLLDELKVYKIMANRYLN